MEINIKIKLTQDVDYLVNDRIYKCGEILEVDSLYDFPNSYLHYFTKRGEDENYEMIDWIPKCFAEVIEQ